MASFLGDRVYDNGLTTLDTEANRIDICSALPTTYTQAITTYSLGSASGANYPGIGSPAAGSPDGRQVTVSAVTNGSVATTGTATHYAIVDTVNLRLLAAGALSASQAVTNGNSFTLTSAVIRFPAPV